MEGIRPPGCEPPGECGECESLPVRRAASPPSVSSCPSPLHRLLPDRYR